MLEGDAASMENTDSECKAKKAEWDERSKVRNGELEAMVMAKKILAKVTGVRNPDEHEIPTKSLFEATARVSRDYVQDLSVSLVQLDDPRQKAINLLRQAASKAHSKP